MKSGAAFILLAILLAACAGAPKPNPVAQRAEMEMRHGAQAYARGELGAARRAYETATRIYESVADANGRARARLNLARIEVASGHTASALAALEALLAESGGMAPELAILAHGRAAAMALSLGRHELAGQLLQAARTSCAGICLEHVALEVIEARRLLAAGQTEAALARADASLAGLRDDSTDRADVLRIRGEALIALARAADAAGSLRTALNLDQARGQADAVAADLALLARAHAALGDTALAARYREQADRARAARQALLGLDKVE